MSESPFIAFYPSDWLAGTRGMSAAETGVYITLIAMMYEREGPLDMDDTRLARLCGASVPAFRKALDVLITEGKIARGDDGLFNRRVGVELEKRAKKRECARDSANARWGKSQQNQQAQDAAALPSQCVGNANHSHIERNSRSKKDNTQHSTPSSARATQPRAVLRQLEPAMAGAPEPPPITLPSELSPSAILGDEVADILGARSPAWAKAGIHAERWTAPRPAGLGLAPGAVRNVARAIRSQRDATGQPPPTSPAYLDGPMADAATIPAQRTTPSARARASPFGACPEVE